MIKRISLYWKEVNKKMLMQKGIAFFIIFGILLIIDQITKNGFYPEIPKAEQSKTLYNWGFLAIRSFGHKGITSKITNNILLIQTISIIVVVCFSLVGILSNKIIILIGCSFIVSGAFGNFLDRAIFDGFVKDILFFPFKDNGTFNLADVFAGLGVVIVVFDIILDFILSWRKNRHN